MKRRERVNPGYEARYAVTPREGARANSSPESVKTDKMPSTATRGFCWQEHWQEGQRGRTAKGRDRIFESQSRPERKLKFEHFLEAGWEAARGEGGEGQ